MPKAHPRQRQFLLLHDVPEILFGGAAGGAKSDAILMAAAQFVEVPGYSAIIFRRTFADMNQPDALIPRSRSWWAGLAHWSSQDHRWTFPSGATVTFAYLQTDRDVENYRGAAYQFIGWDELTQHTEYRYKFMFSRLRKPNDGPLSKVPIRVRSGTNPGGVGHEWVKKRFVNPATRQKGAVFVPSKLADNPSLDRDDYVKSLEYLDPLSRQQLLEGDWDALAEGRFRREWLRYYTRYGTGYVVNGRVHIAESITDRFLTIDPAATVAETAKEDPDYTVISAWGFTQSRELLWLGCHRCRIEVPDIPPRVQQQYARHRAGKVYCEGGGMQKAVVQLLTRHRPAMNVIPLNPSKVGDKLVRATPFLNMAEAGRVWLPAEESSDVFPLDEVEAELLRFTGDAKQSGHDDIVDSAAWAGYVDSVGLTGQRGAVPHFVS